MYRHTHVYIYVYMYICVYMHATSVGVCVGAHVTLRESGVVADANEDFRKEQSGHLRKKKEKKKEKK